MRGATPLLAALPVRAYPAASVPANKGQSLQKSLADLGWTTHFADQIGPEDAGLTPARLALLLSLIHI